MTTKPTKIEELIAAIDTAADHGINTDGTYLEKKAIQAGPEIKEMYKENKRLRSSCDAMQIANMAYEEVNAKSAQQITKLREALRRIAEDDASTWPNCSSRQLAQQALAETKEDE